MNNTGIVLGADYMPFKDVIKLGKAVEKLGYSQISIPEIWGFDSQSTLAVLAHETDTIRLASGIMNMYSRTPALMAMSAASLDKISNHRYTLGLGLSGPKVIENLHGIEFKRPLERTREYVEVLRTLFSNKRLNLETKQLGHLKSFKLSIGEIQQVPIHIAALGPKNVELTAKIADGWIPVIMPIEAFRQEASKVKDINPDIEITPFTLAMYGDDPKNLMLLRAHMAYYFGGMGTFYNNMLRRIGFEEEAENIQSLWKRGKIQESYAAVTDELLAQTCIYGDKEEMADSLQRLYDAGATKPLITMPFKTNFELAKSIIEALSPLNQQI